MHAICNSCDETYFNHIFDAHATDELPYLGIKNVQFKIISIGKFVFIIIFNLIFRNRFFYFY